MKKSGRLMLQGAAALAAMTATALAGTITLDAVDTGWYDSTGAHVTGNQNYIVGTINGSVEFRDFFVFDLSSVSGSIVSATLRAYNPSMSVAGDSADGFESQDPSETLVLRSVSTDIGDLTGGLGGVGAFNDLADGTIYATQVFSAADNGTIVSIALNAAALADLNAASGLFALGGHLGSLAFGQEREHMFAFTAGPTGGSTVSDLTRQLVIETTDVPEPSVTALWLFALTALGLSKGRRNRRQ